MAAVAAYQYWGKVDANIDWCEPNYEVTPYIAEGTSHCATGKHSDARELAVAPR
jgi:hypothetical protein